MVKVIISVFFMVAILFLVAAIAISQSYAEPQSQFQPLSMGDLLWLSTLSKGEVVTVSYLKQSDYNYIEVTYTDASGMTSTDLMLPDKPSSVTISGCNHNLTIIAGVTYVGSQPLYIAQVEVKGNILCTQSSTVSLPLITK